MAKDIEFVDPWDIIIIGLDTDHAEGDHALYDRRAFLETDEALIKNIMLYGIQQPVIIRREAGRLYAVDGRQRVRAAREAAKRQDVAGAFALKVPVIEAQGDDRRLVGVMISTNEQRTATDILDRCEKAVRLLDQGADLDELAVAFGRTVTTIRGWLRLAKASPEIHAAVKLGKISNSAAVELAKLETREEQDAELAKLVSAGERVSEAKAKKARREVAGSSASDESSAFAGGPSELSFPEGGGGGSAPKAKKEVITTADGERKTSSRKAKQSGVKRTWLRKALDTHCAEALSEEQRGVLRWFAYGETEKGSWWDEFTFDAEMEMGEKSGGDEE